MPGQNRDQRLTSVSRGLLLLALGLLLLGSIWWLVLGLLPPSAESTGGIVAAGRPTAVPLLVALVAVASASIAVGLVVRSRQRALTALEAANRALREEVALSRSIAGSPLSTAATPGSAFATNRRFTRSRGRPARSCGGFRPPERAAIIRSRRRSTRTASSGPPTAVAAHHVSGASKP